MRIILDVDGVCCDTMGGLRDLCRLSGYEFPDHITQYDFLGQLSERTRAHAKQLLGTDLVWRNQGAWQ